MAYGRGVWCSHSSHSWPWIAEEGGGICDIVGCFRASPAYPAHGRFSLDERHGEDGGHTASVVPSAGVAVDILGDSCESVRGLLTAVAVLLDGKGGIRVEE